MCKSGCLDFSNLKFEGIHLASDNYGLISWRAYSLSQHHFLEEYWSTIGRQRTKSQASEQLSGVQTLMSQVLFRRFGELFDILPSLSLLSWEMVPSVRS